MVTPSCAAGEVESDGDGVYAVTAPLGRAEHTPEDCATTFKIMPISGPGD